MLILFAGQFRLMFWFWDLSDNPVYAFDEMLASSGLFRLVWRSSLVAILVSLWGVAQVYPVNITWLSAAVACILIYAVATWPDYTNIMRRI
jgi:hypothetical protein